MKEEENPQRINAEELKKEFLRVIKTYIISPQHKQIEVEKKIWLSLKAFDDQGSQVALPEKPKWKSSGGYIDSEGVFFSDKEGTYDIEAFIKNKKKASTTVRVISKEEEKIKIETTPLQKTTAIERKQEQEQTLQTTNINITIKQVLKDTSIRRNKDAYTGGLSYVTFVMGCYYFQNGNILYGLLCFGITAILVIVKHDLKPGPITTWLKSQPRETFNDIRKTIIGQK